MPRWPQNYQKNDDVKLQIEVFCHCIYLCTHNISRLFAHPFKCVILLLKSHLLAFHTVKNKVCSIVKYFSSLRTKYKALQVLLILDRGVGL